jgi:hypothetical protein
MIQTQAPKKPKMPLDHALWQMHDAMEMVLTYDHDPNFVPSADQLVLFELIKKQLTSYYAMMLIVVGSMWERAKCAASAAPPFTGP